MALNRAAVVGMVRDLMTRHTDLDWTCAVQSVAMEIGWNEQELLEDLAEEFSGRNPVYEGE